MVTMTLKVIGVMWLSQMVLLKGIPNKLKYICVLQCKKLQNYCIIIQEKNPITTWYPNQEPVMFLLWKMEMCTQKK